MGTFEGPDQTSSKPYISRLYTTALLLTVNYYRRCSCRVDALARSLLSTGKHLLVSFYYQDFLVVAHYYRR